MTAKKTSELTMRWAMRLGALGLLLAAGAATTAAPRSAHGQTPPPGQAAFNRVCGRCHPNGDEDTGPAIRNRAITEARMREVIRTGTRRMRAIPATRLSDADLDAVIGYLRTMRAVAP